MTAQDLSLSRATPVEDVMAARFAAAGYTSPDFTDQLSPEQTKVAQSLDTMVPRPSAAFVTALQAAQQAIDAANFDAQADDPMTVAHLYAVAPQIAALPEVRAAAEMARTPQALDLSFIDPTAELDGHILKNLIETYLPKTLLVPYYITAEFEPVGITGCIGLAYDLLTFTEFTVYGTGGIGPAAGGGWARGNGIGATASQYDDVNGTSVGIVLTLADERRGVQFDLSAGYDFTKFLPDLSAWAFCIYDAKGVDAGVGVYGCMTIILANDVMPNVVMPDGTSQFDISYVYCDMEYDTAGQDELNFEVTPDSAITPFKYPLWDHFSINQGNGVPSTSGATWDVGFTVRYTTSVQIVLKDQGDTIYTWTVPDDLTTDDDGKPVLSCDYHHGIGNHVKYTVGIHWHYGAQS